MYFLFVINNLGKMSESSIHQMRIFELRNKLKEVGLSSSGTKAELISRLSQYYDEHTEKKEDEKEELMEKNLNTEGNMKLVRCNSYRYFINYFKSYPTRENC